MEVIRVTEEWQRAGVHYVRTEGMVKGFHLTLEGEFDTDTPESRYILVRDENLPVGTCRIHYIQPCYVVRPHYLCAGIPSEAGNRQTGDRRSGTLDPGERISSDRDYQSG